MIKKINIFGVKYRFTTNIPTRFKKDFIPDAYYGLCFGEDKIIWRNKRLTGSSEHETNLHEIGHACLRETGIIYSGLLEDSTEELVVEAISKGSYQYIVELVKDVLKEEDDTKLRDKLHSIIRRGSLK